MTGIKLNNDNHLLEPIKRQKQFEKKQKFKLIITTLSTNLLLFMVMNTFYSSPSPAPKELSIQPKGHKSLELPIIVSFPLEGLSKKIPVSLYNKNKTLIIEKGYLIPKARYAKTDSFEKEAKFIVEIPTSELPRIIQNQEQILYAYPYTQKIWKQVNHINKVNYEITF